MGRKIYLTEEQVLNIIQSSLNEKVYVNSLRNKKANLTYTKGSEYSKNNQKVSDYLKTDKMDEQNSDTYEVTLKDGVICYNITSIRGSEVMHYFKDVWGSNKKATMTIKNTDTNQSEEYDLTMLKADEINFFNTFVKKVGFVVNYCLNKFKNQNPDFKFSGLSIYPVPSSSGFNKKMAELLSEHGLYNMPVQEVNQALLVKSMNAIERDEDFIEKNKDFYGGNFFATGDYDVSVNSHLNKNINRMRAIFQAQQEISKINLVVKKLLAQLNNYHTSLKDETGRNNSRMVASLVNNYKEYYNLVNNLPKIAKYDNPVVGRTSQVEMDSIATLLKYSKGPSIEKRSMELWNIVKPYVRGEVSPVTRMRYGVIDLAYYDPKKFEIKTFTNGERMGLKNMYTINGENPELVQQELEKIKGTVFIIFDDNVSGGATLSDICQQCTKAGIENIIPITFGEMNEKWTYGVQSLSTPSDMTGKRHAEWNY